MSYRGVVCALCLVFLTLGLSSSVAAGPSDLDGTIPTEVAVDVGPSLAIQGAVITADALPEAGLGFDEAVERPSAGSISPSDTSLAEFDRAEAELDEYDPWVKFNEPMFAVNYNFDKYLLKPVATAYDAVIPDFVQQGISNFFQNLGSFRRVINTALQGRFEATGQEFGRLFINSTFGLAGFVDAAPSFGVAPRTEADMGQTLAVWGVGHGPFLVLPLFPPFTVRDAIGSGVDGLMNPLNWILPFGANMAIRVEQMVNDRSLNLELFGDVEASVVDLYSSVRNAYLQKRDALVREAVADSPFRRRERLILTGPEGPRPAGSPASSGSQSPSSEPPSPESTSGAVPTGDSRN